MKKLRDLFGVAKLLALLAILLATSSCIMAPLIESFKSVGATEQDRRDLFENQLRSFQEARQWGRTGVVVAMIFPEAQEKLEREMRKLAKDQKLVEYRIEELKFSESAYRADVDVVMKGYRVPFYVVEEELEKQEWRFVLGSGWRLVAREEIS